MTTATVPPTSEDALPLLLDVHDIQRHLGVSRSIAYDLMRSGVLPTVRIGPRLLRVPRAGLLRWIDQQPRLGPLAER